MANKPLLWTITAIIGVGTFASYEILAQVFPDNPIVADDPLTGAGTQMPTNPAPNQPPASQAANGKPAASAKPDTADGAVFADEDVAAAPTKGTAEGSGFGQGQGEAGCDNGDWGCVGMNLKAMGYSAEEAQATINRRFEELAKQ